MATKKKQIKYNIDYWKNSPYKKDPVYKDTLKFGGDEKAAHDCAMLYRDKRLFFNVGYSAETLGVPWSVWSKLRDKYT
jgi:hypothetical protein